MHLPFASGFMYLSNELHCGNIPVLDIIKTVGTPAYLYNLDAVVETCRSYTAAFRDLNHRTRYAVKANSSLALLRSLAEAGCGFDVNSRGELYRVLKTGVSTSDVTMTGVGKTDSDIRDGLEAGIALFNSESLEECQRISRIAGERNRIAEVILRINPDVDAHTHPYIATGLAKHKFGLSEADAREAILSLVALPHLRLAGFGMHLGSQIFSPGPYMEGVTKLLLFAEAVSTFLPHPISHINIGGGIGVPYTPEDESMEPVSVADMIRPLFQGYAKRTGVNLTVLSEPGRYLVANAGVLLTRIEYVKRTRGRTFVILDAGMNDLIRPALYEAHHEILPVILDPDRGEEMVDIVGPVCESGDTYAEQRRMPRVEAGEYAVIFSAGAYGSTMSSNYNSRPLAAEAAVSDGKWSVVRKRQTLEQMILNEI